MSVNNNGYLNIEANDDAVANNLRSTASTWLNTKESSQVVNSNLSSENYSISLLADTYYDQGYDNADDPGSPELPTYNNVGSGGYYENYSTYDADIYIESTAYDAYAEGCNYGDYGNYCDAYVEAVYFYWTKNNDGVTQMTGTETGLISPWVMAAQYNTLVKKVNSATGSKIDRVSYLEFITADAYNAVANVLGVANVSRGTKITVQHLYLLQTAFNGKGYTK